MEHKINLRLVLCCFFGVVFAERATATSILLTDGRTISSEAHYSNDTPLSLDDTHTDSPSVAFGVFNSAVMSSIVTGVGDSSSSLMSSANQNSTVSPTSFSAVGGSSMSGRIGEGNQGGSVLAHSLFRIRFQLDDCYGYDFTGQTFGGGQGQIDVSAATILLTLEGVGPIFTVPNNSPGPQVVHSGLLSPGTYLLQAEASDAVTGLGQADGGSSGSQYQFTLNLTSSPCVPDSGSTALMTTLGLFTLAAVRRWCGQH
jgi:hypothetical protein